MLVLVECYLYKGRDLSHVFVGKELINIPIIQNFSGFALSNFDASRTG